MRWLRCVTEDGPRTGVLIEDRVHLLPDGRGLVELLTGAELERVGHELAASRTYRDWAAVELLAPLRPPSIRDCVGHLGHIANCRAGLGGDVPEVWRRSPMFYFGCPSSVFGARQPIEISPGCQQFDYELEVAVLIGRPGRDLHPDRALDHVAGLLLFCDWSARDLQLAVMPAGLGPGKGKDGATTLGPWLLTVDELADRRVGGGWDVELSVSLNGTPMGRGNLAGADFGIGEILAYCSRGTELQPGDLIATGTVPTGCLLELERLGAVGDGPGFDGWLKPGDLVELDGGPLGRTSTRILPGVPVVALRSESS